MNLIKLLGVGLITTTFAFLPMKNYAQSNNENDDCKMVLGQNKICFKEKPFYNSFLTEEFMDSLKAHRGKPFSFNKVKFDGSESILNPRTMNFIDIYSFNNKFEGLSISLYIGGYEDISPHDFKESEKGRAIYGVSSVSNKDLYSEMHALFEKGIIQKQGPKDAGVWRKVKKAK